MVDFPATYEQLYAGMRGTSTVASPAIGFHELGFNCWQSARSKGDPLLRDASIRRAVHWAIDKRQIAATAMAGLAEPATSLLSPAQAEWRWDVPADAQYRYDPQRAKQILDDAGYTDRDADGVREDAAGHELSFRLVASRRVPGGPDGGTDDRRVVPRRGHPPAPRAHGRTLLQRRDLQRCRLRPLRLELGRRRRPRVHPQHLHDVPDHGVERQPVLRSGLRPALRAAGGSARSRAPRRHPPSARTTQTPCRRSCTATTRPWSSGTT